VATRHGEELSPTIDINGVTPNTSWAQITVVYTVSNVSP
jgi:hypothetical protein